MCDWTCFVHQATLVRQASAAPAMSNLQLVAIQASPQGSSGLLPFPTPSWASPHPPAGNILLIDEIHTPDSSRYWIADTYEQRHAEVRRRADQGDTCGSCKLSPYTHKCRDGGRTPALPAWCSTRALSLVAAPACPQGQEPQNIDKEFLRLWFRANCDPYNDAVSGPQLWGPQRPAVVARGLCFAAPQQRQCMLGNLVSCVVP